VILAGTTTLKMSELNANAWCGTVSPQFAGSILLKVATSRMTVLSIAGLCSMDRAAARWTALL
jgi:hypothetical protein